MRRPRQPHPRPDVLHLAQDSLGTADQVTVFGAPFDAAIRSTWTMALNNPRRKAVLNEAMDRVYQELNREVPAQVGRMPADAPANKSPGRTMKAPALKP